MRRAVFPDCRAPHSVRLRHGNRHPALGGPLHTYRSATIDLNNPLYKLGEAVLKQKEAEGFEFKFFEGEEAYSKVREVYDISADSFQGGPLYSEIPYEFFTEIYLSWTKNINPAMFIAYRDGEAVGYVYGYENIYDRAFISKTSAVKKKYQKNKLYLALIYLGYKHIMSRGYTEALYHFECEQRVTFKHFDENIESNEKKYAVYIKEL